jgi:hypothetical protein
MVMGRMYDYRKLRTKVAASATCTEDCDPHLAL